MTSTAGERLRRIPTEAPEGMAGTPSGHTRIPGPEPPRRPSWVAVALVAALALVAGGVAGYSLHGTPRSKPVQPRSVMAGEAFAPDVEVRSIESFLRSGEILPPSALDGYAKTVFRPRDLPFHRGVGWLPIWEPEQTAAQPAMTAAPDGTLWVIPRGWLGRIASFDGETWTVHERADGVPRGIRALAVGPDGTLWAAGWSGVSRFDGTTWETVSSGSEATSVTVALDGTVWATFRGRHRETVSRYDGTWHDFTIHGDSVVVGLDGTVWAGTSSMRPPPWKGSLAEYDGGDWSVYHRPDGLPGVGVTALLVTTDGALWAALEESPTSAYIGTPALARFNGSTWRVFRVDNGMVPGQIHAMASGPDGTLWVVATDGFVGVFSEERDGLASFDGRIWRWGLTSTKDLRGVTVGPDGTVWVGKANKVVRYTPL